jgi:hypothetical protein
MSSGAARSVALSRCQAQGEREAQCGHLINLRTIAAGLDVEGNIVLVAAVTSSGTAAISGRYKPSIRARLTLHVGLDP